MTELPNLKKAIKQDTCAVMRCKDRAETAIDARQAWPDRDTTPLPLCSRHLRQVSEYIEETPAEAVGSSIQQDPDMRDCLAVLCDMSVRDKAAGDLLKKEETLTALRALPIRNQGEIDSADDILRDIKKRLSWWKKTKTTCRKPFNEKLEEVSSWCNPPIEFYSEAERIVKVRIRDGREELEKTRKALLQQVEAAHQAGDAHRVQAVVQSAVVAETHLPKGMYQTKHFSFQVNAPDMVPRQFCSPDDKKIRAYIDACDGRVDIPGVTVWPDDIMGQRR